MVASRDASLCAKKNRRLFLCFNLLIFFSPTNIFFADTLVTTRCSTNLSINANIPSFNSVVANQNASRYADGNSDHHTDVVPDLLM